MTDEAQVEVFYQSGITNACRITRNNLEMQHKILITPNIFYTADIHLGGTEKK